MAWTTPRTWTPGELVTALMMNQHVRDNLNDLNGRAAVTYVPTWSNVGGTGHTLGNGSISGAYWRMGQFVMFRVQLGWGSTTASGTGGWSLSIPATSDAFQFGAGVIGLAFDSSSGLIYPITAINVSTSALQVVSDVSPVISVSATVPFTWANGDVLSILGWYIAP